MTKEFTPYEQALALKELGFDEPCFGLFDNIEPNEFYQVHSHASMGTGTFIKAPLYQQAFRFFREKSLLEGIVEKATDFYWYKFSVYFYGKENKQLLLKGVEYKTYEEAELACLIKLIEIVKKK